MKERSGATHSQRNWGNSLGEFYFFSELRYFYDFIGLARWIFFADAHGRRDGGFRPVSLWVHVISVRSISNSIKFLKFDRNCAHVWCTRTPPRRTICMVSCLGIYRTYFLFYKIAGAPAHALVRPIVHQADLISIHTIWVKRVGFWRFGVHQGDQNYLSSVLRN